MIEGRPKDIADRIARDVLLAIDGLNKAVLLHPSGDIEQSTECALNETTLGNAIRIIIYRHAPEMFDEASRLARETGYALMQRILKDEANETS